MNQEQMDHEIHDLSSEKGNKPMEKVSSPINEKKGRNARKSLQNKDGAAVKKLQANRLPNLNKRAIPSIDLNRGSRNQAQFNNRGVGSVSFRPPAFNFSQPTPNYNSNVFVPHQPRRHLPLFNTSVPPPPIAAPRFGNVPQQHQQMLSNPFNPFYQNRPSFGVQTPWTNVPFMNHNIYAQPRPPHQNMFGAPPNIYNGHPRPNNYSAHTPPNSYSAHTPPNSYSGHVPSHIFSAPPPSSSYNMAPPPPPGTF